MELVAKIYNNQFETTPYKVVSEILDFEANESITGVSDGKISLPKYVVGIQKYQIIELCRIQNDADVLVYRGYIADFTPSKSQIDIDLRGEKGLLEFKKVLSNQSFTSNSISYIVTTLLSAWNIAYGDTFSLSTSSSYTSAKKDVKYGDNLFGIIDELVTSANCVWDCLRGVVRIEPLLGNDYTTGVTIKELVFNELDPKMSNIDEYAVKTGEQASIVFGVDGSNTATKSDSTAIGQFGAIAITHQFRKSDAPTLNIETQKYLDRIKNTNFLYDLSVDQNKFESNVGDKVLLRIENTGEYSDFAGSCIVSEKKLNLVNASLQIKYVVSQDYFIKSDFFKFLSQIRQDLNLQIIK